jgi:4-alpha-glucanotransferase
MLTTRAAGVLLHPTSFPGPHGIGTLGTEAFRFLDFLVEAGQSVWEILPLNPTGYGDSPYSSFSAFAGNPLLIDLETSAAEQGFPLKKETVPDFPQGRVDFGLLIPWKTALLDRMALHFRECGPAPLQEAFQRFCLENDHWLGDYALFRALKQAHSGMPWNEWEPELAAREPEALRAWGGRLAEAVFCHQYQQFQFHRQWEALRQAARARSITFLGDLPIFVAFDSSDVWVHPHFFDLDEKHLPRTVAGVPPDYFSPTGQLWGNSLFRWQRMAEDGYAWWVARIRQALRTVDWIRLDHFRGFEAYWAIPGGSPTAEYGEWQKGPGAAFFSVLEREFGDPLPLVAEDLGFIVPEVETIRERFGLPGMKILQFAFCTDSQNSFLPHNFDANQVVYSGTHDNDTTVGYFQKAPPGELAFAQRYIPSEGKEIHWDLVRLAYQSVARLAVIPLQDILGLGSTARMNTPGTCTGNWGWRFLSGAITKDHSARLRELAETYGRIDPFHPQPKPVWM